MSRRAIEFTVRAIEDLGAIATYTSETWGDPQSASYENQLWHHLNRLSEFPASAALVGKQYGDVRRAVADRHIIFYRYDDSRVLVIRILHERVRLSPKLLSEDWQ